MATVLENLITLLRLERIEENLFRGQSQDLGWGSVYGGQVVGQSLSAATQTVPADRQVHSLHANFLEPGDVKRPIVYDVDRIRDGGSFTTRRVVAIQNGHAIFTMSASFQIAEESFEHQDEMPAVPDPESVSPDHDPFLELAARRPGYTLERALGERSFDVRTIGGRGDLNAPAPRPARRCMWFRTATKLPDDPTVHSCIWAYASDHGFLGTALLPHCVTWLTPGVRVASLDHALWFHRPFRVDDWLLYVMDGPAAHGARGLVRGSVFSREGRLVASAAQEGLMRRPPA